MMVNSGSDMPLASGRETGSQEESAPYQRPLSNTRSPAPSELSRNVLRPACGSVGACSIGSCLGRQMFLASLFRMGGSWNGGGGVAGSTDATPTHPSHQRPLLHL